MADEDFDVGARLKAMRMAANLSQRQLAALAGIPHAQISNIETNRNSPAVSTLRKILSGLDVSLADFFEPDTGAQAGPFFGAQELVDLTSRIAGNKTGGGRLRLRQVGDARAHNLQILHEFYEPGADTGELLLQHASSEGGYVVEGELEITVGDEVRVLSAGESYLFDSRTPHRFRNLSSARTIVISACTPPYL
ncbi:cupin domain-containing protein [Mesorhizobium microcysteis]|uniref:Cupin domain-containing protein n=1 Tax=Neoaquamicrobium microcysteis TaxID=2682781 RepID=A0A5D4H900_9HYPH|nr:cupin domain-containing protein [Mesorhizobium microcysteis]TYR36379.1 cupin domain-containing protein [Mesorhizobium microcysteis]